MVSCIRFFRVQRIKISYGYLDSGASTHTGNTYKICLMLQKPMRLLQMETASHYNIATNQGWQAPTKIHQIIGDTFLGFYPA